MSIIFRYVHIPRPDGTLRKAPYIPLYVRDRNDKLIKVIALVDSGADYAVMPKNLALILGLNEQESEKTTGIGGKVNVKKSRLSFHVKNNRENYSIDIPVLVLQDKDSDIPLLLGRNGFFENFHITFRQDEEKIVLKKVNLDAMF